MHVIKPADECYSYLVYKLLLAKESFKTAWDLLSNSNQAPRDNASEIELPMSSAGGSGETRKLRPWLGGLWRVWSADP